MKTIISILSTFFVSQALGAFTITAPTQVDAPFNIEETTEVTITSDQVDTMRKIRLIGLSSTDSQNCVKAFTASESCVFNVSKTITKTVSARIYLYPKDSSRKIHTIKYDVQEVNNRDDLSSGIQFVGADVVGGNQVDFGNITLVATVSTRVYVRNTGGQKTSAIEPLSSNYSGSTSYELVRSSCDGVELEPNETCYFDVRVNPSSATEGTQSGTFEVRAAGTPGSTIDFSSVLTIPSIGGGGSGGGTPVTIGTGPSTEDVVVDTIEIGESFVNTEDFNLQEIDVYLGINGSSITGNIKIEVGTIDSSLVGGTIGSDLSFTGTYPGTIIGESNTVDLATAGLNPSTETLTTLIFPDIELTANTEYFFVINTTSTNLKAGLTTTDAYLAGSQLFTGGGATWFKMNTYAGATNQRDLAFGLRGETSTGSSQNIAAVDYFCTQDGIDNAGYSSPTFCSGLGTAVEIQYISDCFVNPSWCALNTQSENSVRAATNGEFIAYKRFEFVQTTSAIANRASLYFVKTENLRRSGDVFEFDTAERIFKGLGFELFLPSTLPVVSTANLNSALNTLNIGYDTVGGLTTTVPRDIELTEAQFYQKYKTEIDSCFDEGAHIFQVRWNYSDNTKTGTFDVDNPLQFLSYCGTTKTSSSNQTIGFGGPMGGDVSTFSGATTPFDFNTLNITNYDSVFTSPYWNIPLVLEVGSGIDEYIDLKAQEAIGVLPTGN